MYRAQPKAAILADWRCQIMIVGMFTLIHFLLKTFWAWQMPGPSVFFDEVFYRENASAMLALAPLAHAHYPPLYSLVSAPALWLADWYQWIGISNALLTSLLLPAAWLLGRTIKLRGTHYLVLIAAILPLQWIYPHYVMSENLFVTLFVLATALSLRGLGRGWAQALLFGLVLAACHLTRYLFLPCTVLFALFWLAAPGAFGWRRRLGELLLAITGYALPMLAWLAYGHHSGFEISALVGFGTRGQTAATITPGDMVFWTGTYLAYAALTWLLVAPQLLASPFSRSVRMRITQWQQVGTRFTLLTALLIGGYLLLAIQHSLLVPYNHPEPKYMIGRYLMHLTPLVFALAFWLREQHEGRLPRRLRAVVMAITLFIALPAWGLLYGDWFVELPEYFAGMNFQHVGTDLLANTLVFFATVMIAISGGYFVRPAPGQTQGALALIAALGLSFIAVVGMIKAAEPGDSNHHLHIGQLIASHQEVQSKAIVIDDPWLRPEALARALRFFSTADRAGEIVKLDAKQEQLGEPHLLITRADAPGQVLDDYMVRDRHYRILLQQAAGTAQRELQTQPH